MTRTYDQIRRFSQRDADAYLRLLDQYDRHWKPAFAKHRFTTPPPYGTPDAMEALCSIPDSGMEPVAGTRAAGIRLADGSTIAADLVRHAVDPSRAPDGKHVIGVEEFGAPIRLFDKSAWKAIERRFNRQLIDHWSHYAPNMTPDNVIAMRSYGPPDIFNGHPDMMEGGYSAGSTISWQQARYRPIPELSGYKMLLDNVYNCSSNMHSGSGIGRAPRSTAGTPSLRICAPPWLTPASGSRQD